MVFGIKNHRGRQSAIEFFELEKVVLGFSSYLHNIYRGWAHHIRCFQGDNDTIVFSDSNLERFCILQDKDKDFAEVKHIILLLFISLGIHRILTLYLR